ncbi:MAG: TraB/GumN family protein [Bacteroidaceae bacterium]|nr:TraB/GumN family protein [Bacteroidaceae bacterium]
MRKFLYTIVALSIIIQGAYGQILYKISGHELTSASYIVGTLHLANESFVDSIPGIYQAIDNCQQVYGEVIVNDMLNPDSIAVIQQNMMLPNDITIDKILSPDELNRLNALLEKLLGMDLNNPDLFQQLGRLVPNALSSQLTVLSFMKKTGNFVIENAMDNYFQKQARDQGKEVGGLETVSFQMDVFFNRMPIERQKEQLMCLVDYSDMIGEMTNELVKAYYSQDINEIKKMMDIKLNNRCDSTLQEDDMLLYSRNASWVKKMPTLMAYKPTLFVVGAGHLPGEKGLLNLLRQAGFEVEGVWSNN